MATGNWLLISHHVNDIGVQGLSSIVSAYSEEGSVSQLKSKLNAKEIFYLSTCNRSELLVFSDSPIDQNLIPGCSVGSNLKTRVKSQLESIVPHLLKLALGRDSVVIGENQILGQLKEAAENSRASGLFSKYIGSLLELVIRDAKRIRSRVKITNYPTSISTVAGKSLVHFLEDTNSKILMVGFSETNQILGRYLEKWSYKNFIWTNRSGEKLDGKLAPSGSDKSSKSLVGQKLDWQDFLNENTPKVDAICVATKSSKYLVTEEILRIAQPKIVVDLSVPANAEKSMVQRFGIQYLGIDEINHQMNQRKSEAQSQISILDDYISVRSENILGEMNIRFADEMVSSLVKEADLKLELALQSLKVDPRFRVENIYDLETWSRKLIKEISHSQIKTLKTLVSLGATGTTEHIPTTEKKVGL